MSEVSIVGFSPEMAVDFARLNYEWIEKFFSVEPHDREILDYPQRWVIDPGGEIFMAIVDEESAGTVALIPAGDSVLELTKMAVSPKFQGRGIGDELMKAAVGYGRLAGASMIFLETHHKLAPAIRLYRKHGFLDIPRDPNSLYSRADVRMELALKEPTR